MNIVIIAAVGYIIGYPILLRLVGVAHTKLVIQRKMAKMPKTRAAQVNMPKPIWPRMKERIVFSMKDTRPSNEKKGEGVTVKQMFWLIWAAGLAVNVIAAFIQNYKIMPLSVVFFIAMIVYALKKADPIIKGRENLYRKMFEVGKATLGISAEYAEQPQAVVRILEWREILKPSRVQFDVPTSFNADSSENFMRQFNQVFGSETTWVPYVNPEEKIFGWDFEQGLLTLKEMPPLPQSAPWSEHYVLDPSVAWSFFPIAVGVENGIELENPKTGVVENVIGFDLSGEQAGLSKKLGKFCSPNITTSPMVLAAGGTGGGKSLAIDTPIKVKRDSD